MTMQNECSQLSLIIIALGHEYYKIESKFYANEFKK